MIFISSKFNTGSSMSRNTVPLLHFNPHLPSTRSHLRILGGCRAISSVTDRLVSPCAISSFQAKEARSSLKRRLDGRLSRASSTEKEPAGESESKKESDENKENWRLDEYLSDQDSWNESVISGESAGPRSRTVFILIICLLMYETGLICRLRSSGSLGSVISAGVCLQREHDREIFGQWRRADRPTLSSSGPSTSAPLGLNLQRSYVGQVCADCGAFRRAPQTRTPPGTRVM